MSINSIWLGQIIGFFWLKKIYLMGENSLKRIRESILMSKAEFARKARVSPITISGIEQGLGFLYKKYRYKA